jgi:hypothetical protein
MARFDREVKGETSEAEAREAAVPIPAPSFVARRAC